MGYVELCRMRNGKGHRQHRDTVDVSIDLQRTHSSQLARDYLDLARAARVASFRSPISCICVAIIGGITSRRHWTIYTAFHAEG